MKNLANCKPSEFLKQTLRIKKNIESWLTSDDIKEIRQRLPDLEKISESMTNQEKGEALLENQKRLKEQGFKNFLDILEILMDKKADETLSVLALCCFVEPKDVDEYPMEDYLDSIADLISNNAVIRFFISLARLGQTNISIVAKE